MSDTTQAAAAPAAPPPAARLDFIDTYRGGLVVLMVLVHAFHAWLTPEAKRGQAWYVVRMLGGYPGTAFLFISGLVLALGAESLWRGGHSGAVVRRQLARRGLEVFGYALLFRLWMWASGLFTDTPNLFRADVLNCIGLSLVLVGVLGLGWPGPRTRLAACAGLAALIAAVTPPLWHGTYPAWVPEPLLNYVSGRLPRSFFPLFPWAAYTAGGAVAGLVLSRARRAGRMGRALVALSAAGAALLALSEAGRRLGPDLYAVDDYWHTSPAFVAWKLGIVTCALGVLAAVDHLPGLAALRQLGKTSLLVYWVHIELVYGMHALPWARNALDVPRAAVAYLLLLAAMLALSIVRTRTKGGPWALPGLGRLKPLGGAS